jgi:hypothetical protein
VVDEVGRRIARRPVDVFVARDEAASSRGYGT